MQKMAEKKSKRKPWNKSTGRDYQAEREYQSSEEQKANRAARGRARYEMIKKGKAKVGDNKDIGHKDSNPKNNSPSNLKVESKAKNRGRVGKDGKHK